jgi:protease I
MTRWKILAIILVFSAAICTGEHKARDSKLKTVQLPEPKLTGAMSLEQAIASRRSIREFANTPLSFVQIGQLAWAGQGVTDKQKGLRTAPSAGAIYPITLYFATPEGLFVYEPDKHILQMVSGDDVRENLSRAAQKQEQVAAAGCDIIIAGDLKKVAAKYGDNARRFMNLEAGHIAQNIELQAVSIELGAVPVGSFDLNQVRRLCKLPIPLEPLYIVCVGYPTAKGNAQKETSNMTNKKKALLIVASENFRDEELFETKRELEQVGIETFLASSMTGTIKGMLGGRAKVSMLINGIVVDDYDAVVFIGGSGAKEYFTNPLALDIARQAAYKRKILAAICIAPTTLANAGVLRDVKATSFSSEEAQLTKAGAQYTGADVERDGLIITGSGPQAATKFGKAIALALTDKK